MGKYLLIINLILVFHIAYPVSSQELNVIKIGENNFIDVSLFSSDDGVFMGTSGFPNSDENIIYDINGNTFDKLNISGKTVSFHSNISLSTNGNYKNYTSHSFYCLEQWFTVSSNNLVEVYNFNDNNYYNISIDLYFGYYNIIEFGAVTPFYNSNGDPEYVFPFIIKIDNISLLVLSESNINDLLNDVSYKTNVEIGVVKGKVVSCFPILVPQRIICLFINEDDQLIAESYNQSLFFESKYIINDITTTSPDYENIFFKGIEFFESSCVIAYYRSYQDNFLTLSVKYYGLNEYLEYTLQNFTKNDTILVDASDFDKNYKLNDMAKLDNGDIYFAASSKNREKLYIIIFKVNENNIEKKIVTIDLFKDYRMKFYRDLRLVSYQNSSYLGFNHCNQQTCTESSPHSTSLIGLFDFKTDFDFDLIQKLSDDNYNPNEPLIIDLNIYKNNILGLNFQYILFSNIPEDITLLNPSNNSEVNVDEIYHFSSFQLLLPFNKTGEYEFRYTLILSDSISSSNLRRLSSEEKLVNFVIKINKTISTSCAEKCLLCPSNEIDNCISYKNESTIVSTTNTVLNENKSNTNNTDVSAFYQSLLNNISQNNNDIIETENALLQMAPLNVQRQNNPPDISSIDLLDCEPKLREQEQLEDNEDFIILKIDAKNAELSTTYVQFEIYNPNTLAKVDLTICKDIPITIYAPVKLSNATIELMSDIEDAGYNAFDIKDPFYNDICTPYTAQNGADMVLSIRKNEIYDKNKDIYFCQSGCTFENFNLQNSQAQCNCKIQQENMITDLSQLNFDKTEFIDSFYKTLYNSNFRVLKCVKLIFSLKGLKTNYGSYLMSLCLGLCIALIIIHLLTGQKKIMEIINNVLKTKEGEVQLDIFQEKPIDEKGKKDNEKEKNDDKHKETEGGEQDKKHSKRKSLKRKTEKKDKKKDKDKNVNDLHAPTKRRNSKKHKSKKHMITENQNDNNEMAVNTKMDLTEKGRKETKEGHKDKDKKHKHHRHHSKHDIKEEIKILELTKGLNDEELNTLEYEVALEIDKRSYFQYYFSLLKKKHLILFTFWPTNDYNLIPIKILLFIVSFSLYFTINGFFFRDETMNKIYENNNEFVLLNQIAQIFYSSIISSIINMILRMLSLSESKILAIKKEKDKEKAKEKGRSTKKALIRTLIIFIIICSLLMLFFWYFISCFCAVYKNTQLILLEDTLMSFGLSMVYPFVLNLFPGIFRICALRAKNKDKPYLYKFSGYVAII